MCRPPNRPVPVQVGFRNRRDTLEPPQLIVIALDPGQPEVRLEHAIFAAAASARGTGNESESPWKPLPDFSQHLTRDFVGFDGVGTTEEKTSDRLYSFERRFSILYFFRYLNDMGRNARLTDACRHDFFPVLSLALDLLHRPVRTGTRKIRVFLRSHQYTFRPKFHLFSHHRQ